MIILIDVGHGITPQYKLNDPGACGNNLIEANLNEIISNGVIDRLQNKYICEIIILPRGQLSDRTNYANKINADYLISFHCNSVTNINAGGWESHIYTNPSSKSIEYQKIIHNEVMSYLKNYNVIDRGMKKSNFHILRKSNMPAILLENLFVSSPNDAKLLKDNKFLDGLSNAICYGLVLALGLKLKNKMEENIEVKEVVKEINNINIINTKNSVNIIIDGQKLDIDNYIIDDHIYVPLKDICDTFQKEYKWDGGKREIIIIIK